MSNKPGLLPARLLSDIKVIVTHENCPDGIASALLIARILPSTRVLFLSYGSAVHRDLPAKPGMLFCDLTPPRERVREFVAAGAICLDHHKKQEDIVRAFGARGVFADEQLEPGVSGAVLMLREVLVPLSSPIGVPTSTERLARLVGIRDTWQKHHSDFELASQVSEALRVLSFEGLCDRPLSDVLVAAMDFGPILLERKLAAARDVAAQAVRIQAGALRVAVIPSTTLTSDAAELIEDADVVAGFAYRADPGGTGLRLQWSLRSRTGVDVSAIAARHPGGGGHTAAAGFAVPDDGRSPYLRAPGLLRLEG